MKLAPVAVFAFNRPFHLQQVFDALKKNTLATETDIIVFSDGPRNPQDTDKVNEVREIAHSLNGFKSVTVHESEHNKGLAKSIIGGVTRILAENETIIVIEDDLITSPHFLKYMNEGLTLYKDEEKVVSIHGYMYDVNDLPPTFFIKGADCLGWATWKRGWSIFNPDGAFLHEEITRLGLSDIFNYNGTQPNTRMLLFQSKGWIDSWAIRWYASAFLAGKLTLYPGRSLIENIGFDRSGSNSSRWDLKRYKTTVSQKMPDMTIIPAEENLKVRSRMELFFRKTKKPFYMKVADKIRYWIK